MRKLIILTVILPYFFVAKSQVKDSVYLFGADWQPAGEKSAHYLIHNHQINDTCWQRDFYNFTGPRLKSERYRDEKGLVLNGVSYYYNHKGLADSSTYFWNGKKNGESWKLSGDSLKHKIKYIFAEDALVWVQDSVDNDSAKVYGDEKESKYPGGISAWYRYLTKHFQYPDRAVSNEVQGMVVISFIVDPKGNIVDPYVSKSVEYSLDQVSNKLILDAGQWEPAFQNGHYVKSYKRQPINFRIETK